jgi:hypothetical protein
VAPTEAHVGQYAGRSCSTIVDSLTVGLEQCSIHQRRFGRVRERGGSWVSLASDTARDDGHAVFATPGVKRTAFADEPGTTLIALGGTPGKAYKESIGR